MELEDKDKLMLRVGGIVVPSYRNEKDVYVVWAGIRISVELNTKF